MDTPELSKLRQALIESLTETTGEIRVHLSSRWGERNPLRRARRLFLRSELQRTAQRNAVLLYFNRRSRKFALIWDQGLEAKTGAGYWRELALLLEEDLRSTHFENALSITVRTLGITLKKHFPSLRS
jgi:uncharacterized membrane protein